MSAHAEHSFVAAAFITNIKSIFKTEYRCLLHSSIIYSSERGCPPEIIASWLNTTPLSMRPPPSSTKFTLMFSLSISIECKCSRSGNVVTAVTARPEAVASLVIKDASKLENRMTLHIPSSIHLQTLDLTCSEKVGPISNVFIISSTKTTHRIFFVMVFMRAFINVVKVSEYPLRISSTTALRKLSHAKMSCSAKVT